MVNTKKNPNYIYALGRHKTAVARVRVYRKKGDLIVNGIAAGQYFPFKYAAHKYLLPFQLTKTQDKFSFSAKVAGSGKLSQLDALALGLSRALIKIDAPAYRAVLKQNGLLTRDPRMKESRKIGTGGKARRRKQSPKR